eukprot:NODE_54_length_26799_cov_0.554794.p12 type:complete len:109 gc:universal NODE_54_length_26799_cov_0.554794:10207-10533(+)
MEISFLLNPRLNCYKCSKSFKKPCSLYRHERNVHADRFTCKFCLKRIKAMGRPDALRAHLYRCKQFLSSSNACTKIELNDEIEEVSSIVFKKSGFDKRTGLSQQFDLI